MTIRVAVDGIGGLGRHFFLAAVGSGFADLFEVTTLLEDAELPFVKQRLSLDSRYGRSQLPIALDGDQLVVNGEAISVRSPELSKDLDWNSEEIDIVVVSPRPGEASDRLQFHLDHGAKKVVAIGGFPGSDTVIIAGLNEGTYDPDKHHLVSTGSSAGVRAATMFSLVTSLESVRQASFTIVEPPDQHDREADFLGPDGYRRAIAGNILARGIETTGLQVGKKLLPDFVMIRQLTVPSDGGGWLHGVFQVASPKTEKELVDELVQAIGSEEFLGLVSHETGLITAKDVLGSSQSLIIDQGSIHVGRDGMVSMTAWFDADWSLACRGVDLLALICESGVPGTA